MNLPFDLVHMLQEGLEPRPGLSGTMDGWNRNVVVFEIVGHQGERTVEVSALDRANECGDDVRGVHGSRT
jgi:hypothetical protein